MFRLCAALLFVCDLALASDLPNYREWISACAKLPSNRQLQGKLPDLKLLPLPTFSDFEAGLDGFIALEQKGEISQPAHWVNGAPDPAAFFDTTRSWFDGKKEIPFQPFAEKLVLSDNATVIAIGDLHGDVRSLLQMLEDLNRRRILDGFKMRPNYHLIFTGDFTDRGSYGIEVLYTLFRLRMESPTQVHLVRGNHEDFGVNTRFTFLAEVRGKYGAEADITKLLRAYDLLPVVIYLGNGKDFLQVNHGGMEPGYNPRTLLAATGDTRFQLLGELRQETYDKDRPGWLGEDPAVRELAAEQFRDFTPETPTQPCLIGFMWSDFSIFRDEPQLGYGRSLIYGLFPTRRILADASTNQIHVRGVIRGHQQSAPLNPMMSRLVACGGVFRHWQPDEDSSHAEDTMEEIRKNLKPGTSQPLPDGSVWTLNVSPDSSYGKLCRYDFAAAAIVSLAPEFKDWRISTLTLNITFGP